MPRKPNPYESTNPTVLPTPQENPLTRLPLPKQENTPKPNLNQNTQPVQNDSTTFNHDGTITVSRNGTIATLTKEQYKEYNRKFMAGSSPNAQTDPGVAQVLDAQNPEKIEQKKEMARLKQAQELSAQIDQGSQSLSPNVKSPGIDFGQLASSAVQRGVIGAAGGAVAGGPVGAAIVGGGAAISGALNILPQLKEDYRETVAAEYATLSSGYRTLRAIINDANNQLVSPEVSILRYKEELRKIDQAEANLKKLNEAEWLAKAKPELVKFQAFNDGVRQEMTNRLAKSLVQPDPDNNNFIDTEMFLSE